jgi:hypothetical protein
MRANHPLQRTGGQRRVAAWRLRQRLRVVLPPPLSVSGRRRDKGADTPRDPLPAGLPPHYI